MSTTLQFKRGNTTTSNAFTGAEGELFIDTDVNTIVVHDGTTAGGTRLATESSVSTAVSNLVDTAPSTLDTLNELAAALGDDPNFATTISNQLGNKVDDTTQIIAGNGLSGGGTLDTNRTINLSLSSLATSTTDGDGDFFVVVDSANNQRKLTKANINISGFNNDAGYTTNVGDITGVTAGTGLSGGGTSGAVTLNLSHLGFQNLSDPNDDRIAFWDDSAGSFQWLDLGSNLSISGTTLNATDTNTTYSAGNGISLSSTTFSVSAGSGLVQEASGLAHADTSSQSSVNNSNGTVIQDITLDTFGHITAIGSTDLDTRYVNVDGDTMSGNLTVNANVTANAFFGDGSNLTGVSAGATVAEKSDNVTYNVVFTDETSGTQSNAYVNSSVLTFNASTGTLTSTDFDSLSDRRYKENVKTVENASDIVASLTGRQFTWKESQKKSYGVIAQELEESIPDLVTEGDDGMKRVNYNGLLAFLIESNKELQQRIKELEQKVK